MEASQGRGVLIDGHVHLHRCFDISEALDAAARNFGDARSDLCLDEATRAVIWLVEHEEEGASDRLMATLRSGESWELDRSDGTCLHVSRLRDGERLAVILGQQVRTREDLEILVVGGGRPTPSGMTLSESIEASLDPSALVMIPWGFGKWTGARGDLVRQAYSDYRDKGLRLADTGAQTSLRPAAEAFVRSQADDLPILMGSDPFPFPGQHRSIGKTGFVINNTAPEVAWHDLLGTIRSLKGQPQRFGSPRGFLEFVSLQSRMQFRKRLGGS